MTYSFKKIERSETSPNRVRLSVTLNANWLDRMFGLPAQDTLVFEGSGNEWYYTDPIERAEPATERILSGLEMRAEMKGIHPFRRGKNLSLDRFIGDVLRRAKP